MTDDNIVKMPSPLERLAMQIRRDLEQCKEGREQWIEGAYNLCLHLAEARNNHKADIVFGEWCETNGFGKKVINPHIRAAAIDMGRQPVELRKCLEETKRSSIHTIFKYEWKRFGNVSKPARQSRRQQTFDLDAAREVVRPLIEEDQPVSRDKLSKLLNVSVSTVHMADLMERGRLEGLAETGVDPLSACEMPPTMKQRYDAALHTAEKRLRIEITADVKNQVNKEFDTYLDHWKLRIARADRIIASHEGVMSRKEFRIVLAGLHPDHNSFAQAETAFELFKQLEDVLVKPDQPEAVGPALPASVAEMMEAKRQATMARKAKRAK